MGYANDLKDDLGCIRMNRIGTALRNMMVNLYLNGIVSASSVPPGLRWRLLRLLGIDAAPCHIGLGAYIGGTALSIGRGSFINVGAILDTSARITIGDRVDLGPRVTLLTGSHEVGPSSRRAGELIALPVAIGDGAWLGANVTVMPGVTIGKGAVIGTGAVVTSDCDPHCVYLGVPAKRVRTLSHPVSSARDEPGGEQMT